MAERIARSSLPSRRPPFAGGGRRMLAGSQPDCGILHEQHAALADGMGA